MGCPSCGAENRPGRRFCGGCGAALPAACPSCGFVNEADEKYCGGCGQRMQPSPAGQSPQPPPPQSYTPRHLAERILGSRASLEGERKQITVLVADIVESTPLAERLGAEETHAVIRRCFDLMLASVHRYEGTVSQFTGDGILALFGAPVAHEDHAQRAVRAALAIQHSLRECQRGLHDRWGIDFQVRIGLNSGPVVVGTIGTDLNMTYTAIGDTVNLASRIEGLATPGAVVVSEATLRLVDGYFVTRDLGPREVKGKAQPIGVHEVLRPSRWRSRLDVYAEQGLSPLVGREQELRLLEACFAEARAGRGQVVLVSGDPGIGKSRLLHELKRRLEGETLTWLEGRCISYGRDIAYFPVIDVLRDSFAIREADAEAEVIRKVDAGARAMGGEVPASVPFLKQLLSVDPGDPAVATMDARMRKARTFEALRALTVAGSAIRPIVLVHEDLHWVDRLSEEVLSYLAEAVAKLPVMLLLTYRPGYEPPFGDRPYYARLRLASLSGRESAALAGGMLAGATLADELERIVAGKAEGNPFFVEEVIKSLLEIGAIRRADAGYVLANPIEEIFVPDTVQDVIMARLDRLDEEPRRALQTASVIGREFAVRLLDRTAELRGELAQYLRELKAVELIYERSLYPELAYMFKHALTHDVAYASLLVSRRRTLHRLVGEALEELYADRLSEQYETLAHHYERAEVWDRAFEYLVKSGNKALAAFAPPHAVAFYDRALAVLEMSGQTLAPDRAIAFHFDRGQALLLSGDRGASAESFQAMLQAALAAGDTVQEGRALYQLSVVAFVAHRFEDALDYAERARHLALEIGDHATVGGSLGTMAFVHAVTGDLAVAQGLAEEALRESKESGAPAVLGFALHVHGHIADWQGDHDRSLASWDELIEIARRHQLAVVLVRGLWTQGLVRCARGDYDGAIEALTEGIELAARLGGDKMWRCRDLNTLGWVYMDLCNWDLATKLNAQAAAESRVAGDPEIIRNSELNLADCYLALGRLDDAERYLETVERESRRTGVWGEAWMKWRYSLHLHSSFADLWLARGDPVRALAAADACLAGALATNARRYVVKGRRARGEAHLARGRLADAERDLDEGLRVAREEGNPAQLWMSLAALGHLRRAQGRPEDATAAYKEALKVVEGVASSLSDPALRETLLASPQVSSLREAIALP